MAKPEAPTSSANPQNTSAGTAAPKKKKHRAGRNKKKHRQQSGGDAREVEERLDVPQTSTPHVPFYRLQAGNRSDTSLDSEGLMDHRESMFMRPRRQSLQQSGFARPSLPFARHRGATQSGLQPGQRSRLAQVSGAAISEDEGEDHVNDRTPLLSSSRNQSRPELSRTNSGQHGTPLRRRTSGHSRASSKRKSGMLSRPRSSFESDEYDVNNPPSVPTSPTLGSLDDLLGHDLPSPTYERGREAIIDIDIDDRRYSDQSPEAMLRRRSTVAELAERDVCFPPMSEIPEEEDQRSTTESARLERKRTRTRQWPDLSILEDWSREEKEERTHQEHVRAKKINEPVLVGGRLRPGKTVWHREHEDEPFRFTYFNEMFDGTIHARTISDLCQEGSTFKDLFLPDPVQLDESSDEEEDDNALERPSLAHHISGHTMDSRIMGDHHSRHTSIHSGVGDKLSPVGSKKNSRSNTPSGQNSQAPTPRPYSRPKRYGPRPTFWHRNGDESLVKSFWNSSTDNGRHSHGRAARKSRALPFVLLCQLSHIRAGQGQH